jgi:hypothetical protein
MLFGCEYSEVHLTTWGWGLKCGQYGHAIREWMGEGEAPSEMDAFFYNLLYNIS